MIFDLIDKHLEYLSTITKEEADIIEKIIKWDDDQKMAFMMAKRMMDDNLKKGDKLDMEIPKHRKSRRKNGKS